MDTNVNHYDDPEKARRIIRSYRGDINRTPGLSISDVLDVIGRISNCDDLDLALDHLTQPRSVHICGPAISSGPQNNPENDPDAGGYLSIGTRQAEER